MKKVKDSQEHLVFLEMGRQLFDAWIKECKSNKDLDKVYIAYFGKSGFFRTLFGAMYKK